MHSFLNLRTPKDSVASSLNNKTGYSLYQLILKSSTIANSKSGNLFSDPELVMGNKLESRNDIIYPMKRLMEDKLILHLFYLSFDPSKEVKAQSCFISMPTEKSDSIESIYKNILNTSVQNIILYIENDLKYHPDRFKNELSLNLKQNLNLRPENYPMSLIKIFPRIENTINDIPLDIAIKEALLDDIEEELIIRKKIIRVEKGLYFPISNNSMIEKFTIADEFIKKEITPIYYSVVGREIDAINNQETIYKMEPFQEPLTSFAKDRAEILHRTISPYHSEEYPGELAIMTVLLFEKFVLENLIQKEERYINEEVENFLEKFLAPSKSWRDILHFILEETIQKMHPKIWDRLKTDKSLAYTSWYLASEEVYLFAPRRVSAFLDCIKDMNIQPPDLTWKILAFKNLLETNEKYLPGLFSKPENIQLYGALLSRAYMDYFPWYYPLLIYFKYFRDIFFASAKKKIEDKQWELAGRINTKKKEAEKTRIIKYKKITDEKVLESHRREIIDCMDTLYFKENTIPTKQLLFQKCRLQNSEVLENTLKKCRFQIVSIPGDEQASKHAVIYPLDHEWRSKESRLKKMLHKKIEDLEMNPYNDKKIVIPYRLVFNHIISYNQLRISQDVESEENTVRSV
ncbi:MAG: hypothetical protein KBF93_16275 [Leptospiraceae bacterium]|nr:hypothetical protein [Leptospiraceae bacterium]